MITRLLALFFLCLKLSISTVESKISTFQADVDESNSVWPHFWERCVGSGHAALGLREDWRKHLKRAHEELGFQYVRFHGLLDDDMSVLSKDGHTLSFFNVDSIFDFLLKIGMKPLVELSFMPEALASGTKTIFHYKGNITPPKNYSKWYDLIQQLTSHLVQRYGLHEIRSWHFEVWNEPNCEYWAGTQSDYFHLLSASVAAIKSVDSELSVGGPATCRTQWLVETLNFTQKVGIELDFISTHEYPTDVGSTISRNTMKEVVKKARSEVGSRPLFYTEFNDGLFSPPLHDTVYASAFLIKTIIDLAGLVDMLSWWTFSDIFEEQGFISVPFNGGFGLQTIIDVPKPTYRAFQFLHSTGDRQVYMHPYDFPTLDAIVTRNSSHIISLISNHNIPNQPIQQETVCLSIAGIKSRPDWALIARIDNDHANPIRLWLEMGAPTYPSDTQIHQLKEASEVLSEDIAFQYHQNTIYFKFDIPPQGVVMITFPDVV